MKLDMKLDTATLDYPLWTSHSEHIHIFWQVGANLMNRKIYLKNDKETWGGRVVVRALD